MRLLNSFKEWLQNIFGFMKDLYDKDGNTFFIAAIFIILILLILVIVLARRAENSEDKPTKKIKYDDIDWEFHDDGAEAEASKTKEIAAEPQKTATLKEPEPEYGIKDEDAESDTFGREGLPPEVTEALLKSVKSSSSDGFSVPMWMTKQTLSFDDMEAIDAQEWVEEQLREKEAREHDRNVEKATVARIAAILERVELCDKFAKAEREKEEQAEKEKKAQDTEVISVEEITLPEVKKEKDTPATDFSTYTLAKITREAETIKEEENSRVAESPVTDTDEGPAEEAEPELPQWDIASRLAELESMSDENERIYNDLGIPGVIPETEPQADETLIKEMEEISSAKSQDPDRIEPSLFGSLRTPFKRYGANNRDTNRAGRKFTEDELMKQIRD